MGNVGTQRKKVGQPPRPRRGGLLARADRRRGWFLMASVVVLVVVLGYVAVTTSFASPGTPRHFVQNVDTVASRVQAGALGYDVMDMGVDAAAIKALPAGQQAMVWAGNSACGAFDVPYSAFTKAVDELGRSSKVYGWYLSDQPNVVQCPDVVAQIRKRADYLHAHAPGQKAYIAMADSALASLRPSQTHADVFGIDPYPCRVGQACDLGLIDNAVNAAVAAGIPRETLAPIYQVFGQSCATGVKSWRLPSQDELRAVLARWDAVLPKPPLDATYSWERQKAYACPALADANGTKGYSDLQGILREHNALRHSTPVPTAPSVTTAPSHTAVPTATPMPRLRAPILFVTPTPQPQPSPSTPPHIGDTVPPTRPGNLRVAVMAGQFAVLAWQPSHDNRRVVGYRVYRNGAQVSDQRSTRYIEAHLQADTVYTYEVEAYDAAGNVSPRAQVQFQSQVAVSGASTSSGQPVLGIASTGSDQPVAVPADGAAEVSGSVDLSTPDADEALTSDDSGAGADEAVADDTAIDATDDATADDALTDEQLADGEGPAAEVGDGAQGDVSDAEVSADDATADVSEEVSVDGGVAAADAQLDTTYLTNGTHTVALKTTKTDGSTVTATRKVQVQNKLGVFETVRNQLFAGFHGNKTVINNTMMGAAAGLGLLLIVVSTWVIRRWALGGKKFRVQVL